MSLLIVGTLVPIASAATLLPAPTNINTTAVASYQINVSWSAVSGALSYNVYRSTGNGWTKLYNHIPQTNIYDNSCSPSTTYWYLIAGVDSSGIEGTTAESDNVMTLPDKVPSAPTGLGASPSDTRVQIFWTAASQATSYNIYRSSDGGASYTKIGTTTYIFYNDTSVSSSTTYYYKVTGVNILGEGPGSTISTTTSGVPYAPTNLAAGISASQIYLSWSAVSGATSYDIYRSSNGGSTYTQIGTATGAAYTDSSISQGITYYYEVSAVNSYGQGQKSTPLAVTTLSVPSAPTGLAAGISVSQIYLSWNATYGASSYNIYRSNTSGGTYTKLGTAGGTTYTDSTIAKSGGITYYYEVSGVNSLGEGQKSNPFMVTTIY